MEMFGIEISSGFSEAMKNYLAYRYYGLRPGAVFIGFLVTFLFDFFV